MSLLQLATGGAPQKLYVDDVFQSFVRTGTGAEATVTTNIDMTQGYALWGKGRSGATDHSIYHSARGVTKDLVTNTTAAETTEAQGLKSVSATGHTWGTLAKINTNTATYVDWVTRNAANFYWHDVVTKSAGSNATFNFSMHAAGLGMVRVKRTDSTGSWYIWHRSLTAGKLLIGETTAAEATLGHITVSGTTVTLVNGVIADGTYLVEAWAHDTSAEGMIQCGSYSGNDSINVITLGWETQYVEVKRFIGGIGAWIAWDAARGFPVTLPGNSIALNTADVEAANGYGYPTATGFALNTSTVSQNASGSTYIYLAIRRPNKPPTSGTEVYNAIARTGTGGTISITSAGLTPDFMMSNSRNSYGARAWYDRLRGGSKLLLSSATGAEATNTSVSSLDMDGFTATSSVSYTNDTGQTYCYHFFRRAPGFMDIVCYTGTGSAHTEAHNLGVVPELMIVKGRSLIAQWAVFVGSLGATSYLVLNSDGASISPSTTYWNSTAPTASVFSVGTASVTNESTYTYVAYLFATLAGISKVGTYTGNGTTQNIEMGFTTGARFFLVKADSTTGNWVLFDSVRGITSGNDPYLLLNSTAAEDTDEDAVDPYAGGITVNETTAAINTNGVTYIYLGIA